MLSKKLKNGIIKLNMDKWNMLAYTTVSAWLDMEMSRPDYNPATAPVRVGGDDSVHIDLTEFNRVFEKCGIDAAPALAKALGAGRKSVHAVVSGDTLIVYTHKGESAAWHLYESMWHMLCTDSSFPGGYAPGVETHEDIEKYCRSNKYEDAVDHFNSHYFTLVSRAEVALGTVLCWDQYWLSNEDVCHNGGRAMDSEALEFLKSQESKQ